MQIRRSGRLARSASRSGRDVRQPNRVLSDGIGGNKAERRSRTGEERLAATKHDGAEVESILINKTKLGQASRQVRSANSNLTCELVLQPAYRLPDVALDKCGVGAD